MGDLISRLFTKYDELCEKYGVKKLDVIGDAFLGVTNIPDDTPDHAPRAAGFALEAIVAAQNTPICPSKPALGTVNIRFGLATGPVGMCSTSDRLVVMPSLLPSPSSLL